MKILLITAEFPPKIGGIATFSYNIANLLKNAGYDIKILTSVGKANNTSCLKEKDVFYTPRLFDKKYIKILPLLIVAIWICIKNLPEKVLLMKWTHEGFVGYILKKLFNIPYVLVAHGSEILQHNNKLIVSYFMKKFFQEAETVIANSKFTKELLLSLKLRENKIDIIHPCLDLNLYNLELDTQDVIERYDVSGKRVILTIGRLVKRKGHAQVIKVLYELKNKYPKLTYVIIGDGEYKKTIENLIKKYKLESNVKITGFVPRTELQKLYKLCEVYISPSQEISGDVEGFGIALIEASLFGKPVIAGRTGGVEDAIIDGETGFLVNPNKLEEIKEKLMLLLDNEDLREKMGKAGQARVMSEFSLRSQIQKLKNIL